jgi:hypothetical protein
MSTPQLRVTRRSPAPAKVSIAALACRARTRPAAVLAAGAVTGRRTAEKGALRTAVPPPSAASTRILEARHVPCEASLRHHSDTSASLPMLTKEPKRNVCCSQWGFCGTTTVGIPPFSPLKATDADRGCRAIQDFCENGCQSNCGQPSRPGTGGGDVRNTIIGYYEGWRADGHPCGTMNPSQIPVDALTGLNVAFAYITPGTV